MVVSSQEHLVRLPKSVTADDVMVLAGSCRRGAQRLRGSVTYKDLSPCAVAAAETRIVTLTMLEPVLVRVAREMREEDALERRAARG
ncbi:hypothetical protein VQH23_16125 [Pararoseomonas sp. SCSIO 73927]|uniref:hypothetical protein n=1 Tax=Pararoseomonas sp. SCSIO 73927 TaxID=3114537 RepID=UPI0030CF4797